MSDEPQPKPPPAPLADDLDATSEPVSTESAADAEPARPERLLALPVPEPARTADEQLQQRRMRAVDRIATVRDAFRVMGTALSEEQRKSIVAMLVELDAGVDSPQGASVVTNPKAALAEAPKDRLDSTESLVGSIEDKLLAFDDQITDAAFEERLLDAKQDKKLLARYGRLLANRRMPPGPRRNRFERLAVQLLTRTAPSGVLVVLPPDRARPVLQLLIDGLPRKMRQEELDAALDQLYDLGPRIDRLSSPDHLFATGLFDDLHGYKVSMREHLLSPEFVYRSVLLEAKLHNRIETLLAAQEQQQDGPQPSGELTPRAQYQKRLLAERDDVDGRLGARARGAAGPAAAVTSLPPDNTRPTPGVRAPSRPGAARPKARRDRRPFVALAAVVALLALGFYVAYGVATKEATIEKLSAEKAHRLSPLMVLCEMRESDGHKSLHGWISGTRWRALKPRERTDAAEELARNLAVAGIEDAKLYDSATLTIVIKSGLVISAVGSDL